MNSLINSYKKTGNLHHAYALEGDKKTAVPILYDFFENDLKIKTKSNPDFYFNEFENFGIGNGREIQNLASKKAVSGNTRIFVIAFSSITSEAQNSLLKLFEEPSEGVHFFIIISSFEIFLPTLKSRLHILKIGSVSGDEKSLADKFIKASKGKRLELLKDIIENKDKQEALKLLDDLEAVLYKESDLEKNADILNTIQKSRDYIRGRVPSVKMILENIALSV
ncbi:MAG: hypothetical protein QGH85_00485 [Candidatus Pacebacteria bacterium]|mgnify:FL=1|jgi:DNA polymerase III gamma/tau subunit|nr:hypothetical protein [Parcubacteria group bacterium]MDP6249242.1 hypothetical protein [Candidatus Paceibacterota bacterium]MDP7159050.1 hypothetical protein [Candidatus Paceibacterota bacterium]MDP7366616.1 hypothetical protein [Candidatus Paceibacterota bacterium]MDP7466100.1 hypothetical protein [Candidatus Paceibacterota bacterium]|tara:strand:+ start:77 stop:745 length:669 start_codon:yes stop_codon:yes gene_type:complete